MLIDRFGRKHDALRISVTDRCNIRCFYCMPLESVSFQPRESLLTFEEITRLADVFVQLGVHKIRLTGGEPLVRRGLPELVRALRKIEGISDLALTTNGMLLSPHAQALRDAGLSRLNISLDTLRPEIFESIARRSGLEQVLAGIEAALAAGFAHTRINAVSIKGITETEIVPLARFCRQRRLELRFIEYMPLDGEHQWSHQQVLSGREVLEVIQREVGALSPLPRNDPSQPAVDYEYLDGGGVIGLINSVTEPFCGTCNRLRLTADGQLRNCLFSCVEWDLKTPMRKGASDDVLIELIRDAVQAKAAGHGINDERFLRPHRAMYQIGG